MRYLRRTGLRRRVAMQAEIIARRVRGESFSYALVQVSNAPSVIVTDILLNLECQRGNRYGILINDAIAECESGGYSVFTRALRLKANCK